MRRLVYSAAVVSLLSLIASPAHSGTRTLHPPPRASQGIAEPRRALVIGQAAYAVGPLSQTIPDAELMASALQGLGFEVTLATDLDKAALERVILDFGEQLERGGVGLFYYAGHGIQVDGENYLVPTDAKIRDPKYISVHAVKARLVLEQLDLSGSRVNLVILDACRNNPFEGWWNSATMDIPPQGLAGMTVPPPKLGDARRPAGTYIAYSTGEGKVAQDASGYTAALVAQMGQEGVRLEDVFKGAREVVLGSTSGQQLPWEYNALVGEPFYFIEPGLEVVSAAAEDGAVVVTVASGVGDVYVDGQLAWRADHEFDRRSVQLRPGTHRVQVGSGAAREVVVRPGASLSLEFAGDTGAVDVPALVAGAYELVALAGGRFEMGCTPEQRGDCDSDEKPVHSVTVSGFLMGRYEVTQGLWVDVMGSNPSYFDSCGEDCPVENVSWLDVAAFANKLSKREGLEPCYEISGDDVRWPDGLSCEGYRLPTEAEWEYAARADDGTKYAGSNTPDDVAWTGSNAGRKTHPVGELAPNGWGLYDMSGNVYEWVWDWEGDYQSGSSVDPTGPSIGSDRVSRGGSWYFSQRFTRVADRNYGSPSYRRSRLGFRLSRSIP